MKSYYPLIEDSSTALFLDPMLIQVIETVKKFPEYLPFIVCALLDLNILPTNWSLMPSQWPRSSDLSPDPSLLPLDGCSHSLLPTTMKASSEGVWMESQEASVYQQCMYPQGRAFHPCLHV